MLLETILKLFQKYTFLITPFQQKSKNYLNFTSFLKLSGVVVLQLIVVN